MSMKNINIKLDRVEEAMLIKVQNTNKQYKNIEKLVLDMLRNEYLNIKQKKQ